MKRGIAILLALMILAATAIPCFAAVTPRYYYTESTGVELSFDGNGNALCWATCVADTGYTSEVVCKLQRKSGSNWITVKTWTDTGGLSAWVEETWPVTSGNTYRTYAIFRIYNSSGTLVESTNDYQSGTC